MKSCLRFRVFWSKATCPKHILSTLAAWRETFRRSDRCYGPNITSANCLSVECFSPKRAWTLSISVFPQPWSLLWRQM